MLVGKGSILRATNAGSITQTSVPKNLESMENILLEIPINQIIQVPDNWLCNAHLNLQVSELAQSISKHGMIEPVILRQVKDNQFQLLSGYRRYQVIKELELQTITAKVLEGLGDKEAKEVFEDLHKEKGKDNIHETKFRMVSSISSDIPTYLL